MRQRIIYDRESAVIRVLSLTNMNLI